jgi:ferredoxin--NADP+ reductase
MCVDILQNWAAREPRGKQNRIHMHFLEAPVAILGEDGVTGLRTERQELTGDGSVRGTGDFTDWEVQSVYRAIGYRSRPIADLPFDERSATIPHDAGRILDLDGDRVPGMYATGWIKRGPVGLIGHTKKDANETIGSLLADLPTLPEATKRDREDVLTYLHNRGLKITTWAGWQLLDAHEISLGQPHGRGRIKVVPRDDMIGFSHR